MPQLQERYPKSMSSNLVPIMDIQMALKSNKVLKIYLEDAITYIDGKPYCKPVDILRGFAKLGESRGYTTYYSGGSVHVFCRAGFGIVDVESKTAPLFEGRDRLLSVPVTAIKDPSLLVGRKFFSQNISTQYRITGAYVDDAGQLYISYS